MLDFEIRAELEERAVQLKNYDDSFFQSGDCGAFMVKVQGMCFEELKVFVDFLEAKYEEIDG